MYHNNDQDSVKRSVGPNRARELQRACVLTGLPRPVLEYRFCHDRLWRFDLAWPDYLLAAEIDGGVFTGGRHVRGAGFKADSEKFSEAVCRGWRVLRLLPPDVTSGRALAWCRFALGWRSVLITDPDP